MRKEDEQLHDAVVLGTACGAADAGWNSSSSSSRRKPRTRLSPLLSVSPGWPRVYMSAAAIVLLLLLCE